MNRREILQASAALPVAALLPACASTDAIPMPEATPLAPPVARIEPKTYTQIGRTRVDNYAWLKDDNWQEVMRDPSLLKADIRAYLDEENAYRDQQMASTAALQERIYQEMRGRTKEDDSTVPAPDGAWEYYRRFETGAQHPKYARQPRGGGAEQVLIDVDAQAQGKTFYKVISGQHAPDHSMFAYAVDEQGSEIYTVYVKDLATGQTLAAHIGDCTGDFCWSPDARYIFWTFRDNNGRPAKIYRRPARGGEDTLVYDEPDDGFFLSVGPTESHDFILISAGNGSQSEYYTIPAANPTAQPILFSVREPDMLYAPTHWDGRWYIVTNADGAVDFKIMTAEVGRTGRAQWREFLAHEAGRYVLGLHATKDYLVRAERVNALPRIVIRHRGGAEHDISLGEQAYNIEMAGGYEYDTATLRYIYESPTTPLKWFDYDMSAKTQVLRKTQEIPSGHNPDDYLTGRFFALSSDGKRIPITVLYKRGTPLNGSAPLYLYGYGSYGISMDADFSVRRFSLVDRGWIYAIAHVRGGSEMGFGWFQDGRRFNKRNTFTDFIAVAEELIGAGYGRPGNIVCEGRSAGGLLMGAINNMRPDLWAGVIGGVPFIDVINTMSDTSLPLTPPEWPEWGNPLEDAAAYDYMASYCPYTNITPKNYPAVLSTGGLTDPRVTYWEPAKWVAKLRPHTTSGRPILLKMNMGAGHAGSAGRFEFLRELAHDYAFAIKAIGAEEAGGPF
jgi:oligopeptidase B